MHNSTGQTTYTIEEIRVNYPHGLSDWACTEDEPIVGEPITWEQFREAFPPPEREEFTLGNSPGNIAPPDLAAVTTPTVWTPCIFDAHTLPAAAYLDPEGWTEIMKLKRRTWMHWRKSCPNTYAVATALFDGLIQHDLWGYHRGKKQWTTVTAGKKPQVNDPNAKGSSDQKEGSTGQGDENHTPEKQERYWPDKQMTLIDMLNALGNPDKHALGSTDARMNVYEREDIWRHPFRITRVNRLRIDVDMDRAWGYHPIFDEDQEAVVDELMRETSLIKSLGLTPYYCKTGGRGHQIVIPTPTLDRSVASLLILMIRYLLAEGRTQNKKPRYKTLEIDKSNLDCLLRLPLGRHAATHAVAWMIDPDTATVLPPDQQVQTVIHAWNYRGVGCDVLEDSLEELGIALDGMDCDRDATVCASTADTDRFATLGEIIAGLPDCPILQTFVATCDAWDIPSLRRTTANAVSSDPQQPYYICGAVSSDGNMTVPPIVPTQTEQDTEGVTNAIRPRVKLGNGWARQVIDESFGPGEFHGWARSDGHNGIGAAILLCDGDRDRAEALLIAMADTVDCRSEAERDVRRRYIRWAVPLNNIDTHYERSELSQHRDLHGVILASETKLAKNVVTELIHRRRTSDLRRKVFDSKALMTLQHIVELVLMEVCNTEDGFLWVSARTLAAEITARWPADATDGKDVSRQMEWITQEARPFARRIAGVDNSHAAKRQKCLFCVLEALPSSRRAFAAQGYVLGNDLIAILPLEA